MMKRNWIIKIIENYHESQIYVYDNRCELFIADINKDVNALFSYLHEIGHLSNGMIIGRTTWEKVINTKTLKNVKQEMLLFDEIDAWIYAFKCVKKKFHAIMFVTALSRFLR